MLEQWRFWPWSRDAVGLLVMVIIIEMKIGTRWGAEGQQAYVNNHQLACYDHTYDSLTKGFLCNAPDPSCPAYLTFRAQPPYTTPATIAYLLGLDSSSGSRIASLNNISSDVATIPTNTQVVVPVTCSCFNLTYYQHNASYTLKDRTETYFTVANLTYQGLTTCQAMMSQNSYGDRKLLPGMVLTAPLRCACPTLNQTTTAPAVKYLLTYVVTWGDSITAIASTFGVEEQAVLDANQLSSTSIIFPFTPLLVPLTKEPTQFRTAASRSPPAAPPPVTTTVPVGGSGGSGSSSSSNSKWVYVGVGIGAAVVLLFLLLLLFLCYRRRTKHRMSTSAAAPPKQFGQDTASLSAHEGVKYAVESLTLYKFEDLVVATGNFGEDRRFKGTSVYRGNFKGDEAAVKVMKGDVSGEINILKNINHSNIIRLSGFCVHDDTTYLVYEYADRGSLYDWLHHHPIKVKEQEKQEDGTTVLSWKQRVQIAYDVADALNYLHNYTNPPCIHKNLKSSNILLDSNFRAKVSNFGLARTLLLLNTDGGEGLDGGGGLMQLTRHVVGTHGYLPPEYIENGVITPEMDVFAFGVILLELLSGKDAVIPGPDKSNDHLLSASINGVLEGDDVRRKLQNFVDSSLKGEYPLDLAYSMAQLAKSCVAHDVSARPSITQASLTLSKILSTSLDWDPSSELQHSRSLSDGR